MSDPRNLFRVNMLHAEVVTDETELRPGAVITIDHDFFGFYQQRRQARIREVQKHFVAFGEHKAPEVPGRDPFPHQQSFRVVPVDEGSCILVNSISGRYVFPGAGLLGERLFRRYMPALLDDDNQVVAVGLRGHGADQGAPATGAAAVAADGVRGPVREEVDAPAAARADARRPRPPPLSEA